MSLQDKQFTTFYLGDRLYGVDVMQVQEVIPKVPITLIRLAPSFVKGLINLRGQIATEIALNELLGVKDSLADSHSASVVCKIDHALVSFQVDIIGEVIRVSDSEFEPPPITLGDSSRKFIKGIYKINGAILSVVEIENIMNELNTAGRN